MKNTPKMLIIHHEAPPQLVAGDRFKIVDDYHKKLGWGGIGYHYFIEKTGVVKQGRMDDKEGAHTIGKNTTSLGICLAGNFDLEMPTQAQIESLKTLCLDKMRAYGITLDNVFPHRKFAQKSCYGSKLSDQWITDLLTPSVNNEFKEETKRKIIALLGEL